MAVQLLSGPSASAIYFLLKDKEGAGFVHLVYSTSDIFNSKIPIDFKKKLLSGYSIFYEKQIEIFSTFEKELKNIKVRGKKTDTFSKRFSSNDCIIESLIAGHE